MIWDYHVILIRDMRPGPLVYDQDSVLSFPCPFSEYWEDGIRSDASMRPDFVRNFRLVAAADFLQSFASDRSHMRNPVDGSWLKPPPQYPCIQTPNSSNNLPSFICMHNTEHFAVGKIFESSDSLKGYFTGQRSDADEDVSNMEDVRSS